ncbi:winged helix DNA-binding domain-containing protein [Aeromicrobium wangtongii]|uniref:winged helix DNA-binding domain-containing protein n=1 Tax=Aeromicrobium wangtongii TaxID=2969247 RepID=UPI0020175DBD|nr:winged helix DNA-binding domain-containing protein [Aeromicrobium wangtongii]MCL3820087.1 winged helix DNA-binding domain-containing protein [Aeromicrobium wangtongii]
MKPVIGRLHAHGLDTPRFDTAVDVVRHLGCVQSQLHDMALWGVARRSTDLTLPDLQTAFDRGDFVRTHVLRPTWHFVAPEDVHWLLALTGPRVERQLAVTNRTLGLARQTVERGVAVIAEAVSPGAPLTRGELAACLAGAGLDPAGQALAHIVMQAELDGVVASGPMRGKQHTYRTLPPASALPGRDDLLAAVARRYAAGHGPFRDKDLAWWTSLTLTDSRRAIELAQLQPIETDHGPHWTHEAPVDVEVPAVLLLPAFDEYVSYARDPDDLADLRGPAADLARGTGLLAVRGRLAGTWTRSVSARRVEVRIDTPPPAATVRRAIDQQAADFARFLSREPVVTFTG